MTTDAEVRGHFGRLWDPFTRGHFGRFGFEETAIVPVTPSKPKKQTQPSPSVGFGGAPWRPEYMAWAPEFEITELGLEDLVCRVVAFAESPELRTWTSAVLSIAGRKGVDLSTEKALAKVLLETVQASTFPLQDPTAKALYLAAGLVAVGLPTAIVAHGELVFTRALAAVQAEGRWWYADPNGPHAFGYNAPFTKEKLLRVPAGAEPPPDELSQYKKQVEEQQAQIQELQAKYVELKGALEKATQTSLASASPSNERIYKYVAVGALGLLAVTLVLLYRETRKGPRALPSSPSVARRKRRTPGPRRRRGGLT